MAAAAFLPVINQNRITAKLKLVEQLWDMAMRTTQLNNFRRPHHALSTVIFANWGALSRKTQSTLLTQLALLQGEGNESHQRKGSLHDCPSS